MTITDMINAKLAPASTTEVATDLVRYTITMKESQRTALNNLAKRTGTGAIALASDLFNMALETALKAVEEADKKAGEKK